MASVHEHGYTGRLRSYSQGTPWSGRGVGGGGLTHATTFETLHCDVREYEQQSGCCVGP